MILVITRLNRFLDALNRKQQEQLKLLGQLVEGPKREQ
jgi:hypothetical protein